MKKRIIIFMVICVLVIVLVNIFANMQNNIKNEEHTDVSKQETKIVKITSENFEEEVLKSVTNVLLCFSAQWCEPCKNLAPIIEEIAKENEEVKVVKVDLDEEKEIVNQYEVTSIPTLILIQNGKEKGRLNGFKEKEQVLNFIKGK